MPAHSITGWVLVVRSRCSCGPSRISAPRSWPSAAEASSRVSRTAGWSPQALSMPTDCEPWPGKTNANEVMAMWFRSRADTAPHVKPPPTPSSMTVSPARTRPPRTATSSASGIDAAEVLPCRSTVTMTLSIGSFSLRAVACMMRMLAWCGISQSSRLGTAPGLVQHGARRAFEHAHGQLEHRLAVHLQQRVAQHLAAGNGARHTQDADMPAVGMQIGRQDAGRVAGGQHHRAGAVAKEHAGAAIVEVEDAREDLGTDDQRAPGRAGADHRVGNGQRIDEARAHRLHVEGRAAVHAQLVLHDAGRGREDHVRRRRWRR